MGMMMTFGLSVMSVHTGFTHLVCISMITVSQMCFCALNVHDI